MPRQCLFHLIHWSTLPRKSSKSMSESALFAATLKLSKQNSKMSWEHTLDITPPKTQGSGWRFRSFQKQKLDNSHLAMITQWRRNFHDYLSSPNGSPTKTQPQNLKVNFITFVSGPGPCSRKSRVSNPVDRAKSIKAAVEGKAYNAEE